MTVKTGLLHTPPASVPGGIQKRAAVKYAPIASADNETHRSGAVGAMAIKVETGEFFRAVIVAKTRDSKVAARSGSAEGANASDSAGVCGKNQHSGGILAPPSWEGWTLPKARGSQVCSNGMRRQLDILVMRSGGERKQRRDRRPRWSRPRGEDQSETRKSPAKERKIGTGTG